MKVAKVRYELEHLLLLRHFEQIDVECRELLLVINGINNAKFFNYSGWRLQNYYGECDENKDEYDQDTYNKPTGVLTDVTEEHEIQLNFKLPPGAILVRLEPGMEIPKGAKLIQPEIRFLRDDGGNGNGKGNETDTRNLHGTENVNGSYYKKNDPSNDYTYCSIINNCVYADTPRPNIVRPSNIRRRSFKYDPHKVNVKNPYSAGFFPSPNIANVVSSSFNPYSKTGFYPHQDTDARSTKTSPTTTATSKKPEGVSDDSESQQSTQESSFDIQIQIEPV